MNTITPISARTVGAAFTQFLKAHAVLHTQRSLVREDPTLPERIFDAIGVLIDARITGVGLPIHLNWIQSIWPTEGNYLTLSQKHPFVAALSWITNDDRNVLLKIDTLGIPSPSGAYALAITADRIWINDETVWSRI